jgi:hypothetical protein
MQVASRLWVLWGIIVPAQVETTTQALTLATVGGVQLQLSLVTLLTAWSITEVIRYGFFACKVYYGSGFRRVSGFYTFLWLVCLIFHLQRATTLAL